MSSTETCGLRLDTAFDDEEGASTVPRDLKQHVISCDLSRAIEELRAVPVLRSPTAVAFVDNTKRNVVNMTCDVVDCQMECKAVLTNAPVSGTAVPSETSNRTTSSMAATGFTVLSGSSCSSQTDDRRSSANGDRTSSLVRDRLRSKHLRVDTQHQSSPVEWCSDACSGHLSDSVFVDVATPTPIDDELLIDDVYEREMDQLDQLDVEVVAADDWPSLPAESTGGFDQRVHHTGMYSADLRTGRMLTDSSRQNIEECSVRHADSASEDRRVDVDRQSDRGHTCSTTGSSTFACVDTSAEERFETIVESMKDTLCDDDVEANASADVETQFATVHAASNSGPERRETVGHHCNITADSVVLQPPQLPPNRRSVKSESLERKRHHDLTICLASTLSECLKALSYKDGDRLDATAGNARRQKCFSRNGDPMNSWPPSRTNGSFYECRHNMTSSSSGFQSDLMDVDIDEEFDANASLDDSDQRAVRPGTESTSLDSLLEMNDEDDDEEESYSHETILRRPIPTPSQHSAEKPTLRPQTSVKVDTAVTSAESSEDTRQTVKHSEGDGDDEKDRVRVVPYDAKSPKIEVLDEELITQEIVLNIVLPRKSKKTKKPVAENSASESSVERNVSDRGNSDKTPLRDFHVHRVIRCSDADDRPKECPESKRQISATENGGDGEQLDSSALEPSRSLVSRYVGGPLSVELERNAESSKTQQLDDDTRLRVTHRNRFKVLRAPGGSGTALFKAPVTSVSDVVDEVGRTLVGGGGDQPLPRGLRVTCDAVERKSSTSLPGSDVTVVRRTVIDDNERQRLLSTTAIHGVQ